MKKKLLIIGGGLNGLQSALSAAQQIRDTGLDEEIEVMLIGIKDRLTVPAGFLSEHSLETLVTLEKHLQAIDVRFMQAKAELIRPYNHSVMVRTSSGLRKIHYDFLVLAAGHQRKDFVFDENTQAFKVDELNGLERLYDHIGELSSRRFSNDGDRTLIIGGGLISFPSRIKKLVEDLSRSAKIVFRAIVVGKIDKPGWLITDLASEVRILPDDEITGVDGHLVTLESGHRLIGATLVYTSRHLASPLTRFFNSTKDSIGRLKVNIYGLVSNYRNVIVVGFSAYDDEQNSPLLQNGVLPGKLAGVNAVRILCGIEPTLLQPTRAVKNKNFANNPASVSLSA